MQCEKLQKKLLNIGEKNGNSKRDYTTCTATTVYNNSQYNNRQLNVSITPKNSRRVQFRSDKAQSRLTTLPECLFGYVPLWESATIPEMIE